MQIIYKDISEIKEYGRNPRKNDEAVKYVAESIKRFGFKVPVVIDRNNTIVAGHTRLKACKVLGISSIPCIVADDLTDKQVKAFRLADNKVSEKASWDFNILPSELEDLVDFDMEALGFEDEDISSDGFGDDFSLPDGDKSEICQVTFTLHNQQKELIDYACKIAGEHIEETFGNTNKMGNSLYEVIREWAEQRK